MERLLAYFDIVTVPRKMVKLARKSEYRGVVQYIGYTASGSAINPGVPPRKKSRVV